MTQTLSLRRVVSLASLAVLAMPLAQAQFSRTGPEWTTAGMDAQRSRGVPGDVQIDIDAMRKPGFAFLWKQTFANKQAGLASLSEPVEVNTFIGYRGFKALSLVGGVNALFAVDYDLGTVYWEKRFDVPAGTAACGTGVVAAPGKITPLTPPPVTGTGAHGGYHSAVSKPGAGVDVSLVARVPAARPTVPPPAPASTQTPAPANSPAPNGPGIGGASGPGGAPAGPITGPVRTGPAPGTGLYKGSQPIFAVSTDGVLHGVSQGSSKEIVKPMPFLPAGTGVFDLIDVEDTVYTATVSGCGPASDAVYALDVSGPGKTASSWKSSSGGLLGAPAFTEAGTAVVVTPKAIVELKPKTLTVTNTIAASGSDFVAPATIFSVNGKAMIATATSDGRVVVYADGGKDVVAASAAKAGFKPTLLTTYEDTDGVRWVLAADGVSQTGVVQSFKLRGDVLEPVWTSPVMSAPGAPIVINGVVFAVATGQWRGKGSTAETVKRSKPAVVYAMDAATGAPLWNSGKSMTSFVSSSALAFSPGQIYIATYDNTLYAFGFPVPRQ